MENDLNLKRTEVKLSEKLLTSFAKFLAPEIKKFFESDEGKAYYEKWLEKHAEYAA
jgi:hypothetical protein